MGKCFELNNGRTIERASRWIRIDGKEVTPRHSLYYYADKENGDGRPGYLSYFRYNGREYALSQFISRYSMFGFDQSAETYPAFITGYDADGDLYTPLLCELDEYGERIRLYREF